jgi:TatD DNase family protein
MHCFTESLEVARAALDLGMYLSFSGILTFKNAAALREVAAYVPEDRILVETDAPYLTPVPHRGKTNEPAYVRFVAECLAQVRGVSFERIAERTTENFFRLFFGTRNSAQ